MFAEMVEYSQNMLSEVLYIAPSQFDEYPELGSRSKIRPIKN